MLQSFLYYLERYPGSTLGAPGSIFDTGKLEASRDGPTTSILSCINANESLLIWRIVEDGRQIYKKSVPCLSG